MKATVWCAILSLSLGIGSAQTPPGGRTSDVPSSFDVASVRPNNSGDSNSHIAMHAGRLTMTNVSLFVCIKMAYNVDRSQISGPAWLQAEKYNISAETSNRDETQTRLMLQTLLADRFKLTLHHEQRVIPVYELVVGRSGPKIHEAEGDQERQGTTKSGVSIHRQEAEIWGKSLSMRQLADLLSRHMDRPVIDKTVLNGIYNITLKWAPDEAFITSNRNQEGGDEKETQLPSIFTAIQEQLGLKLQPRKNATDVLMIDRADKVPIDT